MEFAVPLVVLATLGIVLTAIAVNTQPYDERAWLQKLLLAALFLRVAAAVMFVLFPATRIFHEDAEGYEGVGMLLGNAWRGEGPPLELPDLHNQGYFYLCGAIYYIFGNARIAASMVNCVLGTLTVFLVYQLARQFFHVAVARRAAQLLAFFPSMILWGAMALKDTPMTFLIVVSLSSCVALKRSFSVWAALGTLLPIIAMQPIRFYMIYFLGFAVVASLLFERSSRMLTGLPKQMMVAIGAIGLFVMVGFAGSAQSGTDMLTLEKASAFRQGMATSANTGFAADVDLSTPGAALAFMPLGLTMLLFSPFPWQFVSARAAMAAPEMFVWWFLVPSLYRGIRFSIKHILAETSPMLLFSVVMSCAYSLVHGNIGSGFRQRAQIFVFLFIFTALGVFVKRCTDRGIDPRILLNKYAGMIKLPTRRGQAEKTA
jgi:4-amino-4-deoxy-L-arabinose transferase-like glycosyltransferase